MVEQNIIDEEQKKLDMQRQRVSLTVRFNGKQMSALHKIYWQLQEPHGSLSQIIREATVEHLARKYGVQVPLELNYYDEKGELDFH